MVTGATGNADIELPSGKSTLGEPLLVAEESLRRSLPRHFLASASKHYKQGDSSTLLDIRIRRFDIGDTPQYHVPTNWMIAAIVHRREHPGISLRG
jgi:hypothetical protein